MKIWKTAGETRVRYWRSKEFKVHQAHGSIVGSDPGSDIPISGDIYTDFWENQGANNTNRYITQVL